MEHVLHFVLDLRLTTKYTPYRTAASDLVQKENMWLCGKVQR